MNKTASHSNTPVFNANKSQTSARLYQHPTAAEMKPSFSAKAKTWFSNFCAVALLVAIFSSITIMFVYQHSDEMDRQTVAALKQTQGAE